MDTVLEAVKTIQAYLWNFPMLVLLLGTHIYFTFRLGIIHETHTGGNTRQFYQEQKGESGNVSPYSALSNSLSCHHWNRKVL